MRAACFALATAACACGQSARTTPVSPPPGAPIAAAGAAGAASSTSGATPAPTPEPDISAPILPYALSRLPAALDAAEIDRDYARGDVLTAACGSPDLERRLMETAPIYEAKGVGPALFRAEEARLGLLCRRELRASLGDGFKTWVVSFPLPRSSSEWVRFFHLDVEKLPATASHGHDAAALTGLPWARCFSGFPASSGACDELSAVIGMWPEGNLWVAGRVQGIAAVLAAYRANRPSHPRAAELRALLDAGSDLAIRRVQLRSLDATTSDPLARVSVIEGAAPDGTDVKRRLAASEEDAVLVEAALHREREAALNAKTDAHRSCGECPPGLVNVLPAEYAARVAHEPKAAAAMQIGRHGLVVEVRAGDVEDAALAKAQAALKVAQDKRAAKIRVLLEAWMNGAPPKPEAFAETQGAVFVEELRRNLH
jgi:hypothetical protein